MSEALGNVVDRAMVSEATRRDARGQQDRGSLEAEIAGIEEQRRRNLNLIRENEARLSEINAEIVGRRLPRLRYEHLCSEQARLKREIGELTNTNRALNEQWKRLRADLPAAPTLKPSIEAMLRALTIEIRGLRQDFRAVAQAMRVGAAADEDTD